MFWPHATVRSRTTLETQSSVLKFCSTILLTAILPVALTTAVACSKPENVTIVDGARASIEEMNANQILVISYLTAMDAYLECLASDTPSSGLSLAGASSRQRKKLRDEAIDAKEALAAAFNEQVRVFKATNP